MRRSLISRIAKRVGVLLIGKRVSGKLLFQMLGFFGSSGLSAFAILTGPHKRAEVGTDAHTMAGAGAFGALVFMFWIVYDYEKIWMASARKSEQMHSVFHIVGGKLIRDGAETMIFVRDSSIILNGVDTGWYFEDGRLFYVEPIFKSLPFFTLSRFSGITVGDGGRLLGDDFSKFEELVGS